MDGRRHSVDVPISRALIALRRVRSLRDPSTNSMSKLSAMVDNLNWEANSNNAIILGFENGGCEFAEDQNVLGLRSSMLFRDEEQHMSDREICHGSRRYNSTEVSPNALDGLIRNTGSTPHRSWQVEGSDAGSLNQETVCENERAGEKNCKDQEDKGEKFTCMKTSSGCCEGGGSCNKPEEKSEKSDKKRPSGSKRKHWRRKHDRPSRLTTGDVISRTGSPCMSIVDTPKEGSSYGLTLYENEDGGFMEPGHKGCGMRSCWSRTLKFRESNLLPSGEEQPLLLRNAYQEPVTDKDTDWRTDFGGLTPYLESPRSLCHKFMPKAFHELEGQNMVVKSLMNAISSGRVASLYLFHGPRGTGKTSAARIFAAALNCLSPQIDRPCGLCQECILLFSGRSRDVKELDPLRINRTERCRSLLKNAQVPPVASRFKVFIIDECHMLRGETWSTILNSLEVFPRHVVFIMLTPELDRIPRTAVAKSQRYHFQKVKEVSITSRLQKICVTEGLEFNQDALNLIAAKSNGSIRDAEMLLDQLSLLGQKITVTLVYEVAGVVSDDELLDLLYLALSGDASNTVKRARELMRSRIDPLQLVSQLANLIMDILSGKCPDGASEVRKKLFGTDNSETDIQQLSHALKILSQTEKQLRMSKNQTTWLTAALLQLSSTVSSDDVNDARLSMRSLHPQDGDFQSTSSTGESLKHPVVYAFDKVKDGKMEVQDGRETLELVWRRAAATCSSGSLKKFLQKRGKLVSVSLTQDIAVAELEFDCLGSVSKAEKAWKVVASALQHTLGHNVELRINLAHNDSNKHGKLKKPSFNLFNCSRRVHLGSQFSTECGTNASENSDMTPTTAMKKNKYVETCSSDCGSQISHTCCNGKELFTMLRNGEGNALSIGVNTPNRSMPNSMARENQIGFHTSYEGRINTSCPNSTAFKPKSQLGPKQILKMRCWRTAMLPFRKAWQLTHRRGREHLVDFPLPYAAAN